MNDDPGPVSSAAEYESVFRTILEKLCRVSGARAVALVDAQGETVDHAGEMDDFDVKIAAAEGRILLELLEASRFEPWAKTRSYSLRGSLSSLTLWRLAEGYAIVVLLPQGGFNISRRAKAEASRELCAEAGCDLPSEFRQQSWCQVELRSDSGRRPTAMWVDGQWCELEVLGLYVGSDIEHREAGYRVRLTSGAELTVVREAAGRWYADDSASLTRAER